ncbi:hypothetical protein GGX14DRAFT_692951 [Mycena pura]|uniref:Transmembrane protein 135 N-terminal domain-containing protein n=1 Tax=Mycena pura TaxID=153505 RepID=A0AAD7E5X9_9AGAR|nr:hypothetical protein GGX14DRAFT_692951 [Mycena pura]
MERRSKAVAVMDNVEPPAHSPPWPDAQPILSQPRFMESQTMLSFENLIALANNIDARNLLWRDKRQPVVDLPTLRDCLEHAIAGGTRSAALGFAIRASFSLFLSLIRLRKAPAARWVALVRHAIFGIDSFRFAAMLGTFAALYKFLLNALPIIFPAFCSASSPFGDEKLIESPLATPNSQPGDSPHLPLGAHTRTVLVRKRTRRWHSALAGAISGGLAIMWEKRSRRTDIAQQVFVRGLQGAYNTYSERRGFSVPHGAVIVFSLACGQIMYAFFLRPDTLPRSYVNWIQGAGKTPADSWRFNRRAVQEHAFDMQSLDNLIARADVTQDNLSALLSLRRRALAGGPDLPHYIPCCALHPMATSCIVFACTRFLEVARGILPVYSVLHFVPGIIFRWKMFRAEPMRTVLRAGVGSLRSSAFLGAFVVVCQGIFHFRFSPSAHPDADIFPGVFCIKHRLYEQLMAASATSPLRRLLPRRLVDVLISRGTWWFSGFATGLALLVEDKRRRVELAMYVLPKALESFWLIARGRGLVWRLGAGSWGEGLFAAIGMGMVMTVYQNDPQVKHLSGLVQKILYQFIGPN